MVQFPGQWSARPRAAVNHPERAEAHELTMAKQGFNLKALTGLQADELNTLI